MIKELKDITWSSSVLVNYLASRLSVLVPTVEKDEEKKVQSKNIYNQKDHLYWGVTYNIFFLSFPLKCTKAILIIQVQLYCSALLLDSFLLMTMGQFRFSQWKVTLTTRLISTPWIRSICKVALSFANSSMLLGNILLVTLK